jgi:hypothetical protein
MIQSSLLFSFFILSVVSAERYTLDISNHQQAFLEVETTNSATALTRQVQSSNEEPCFTSGPYLICQYSFAAGTKSNETMIHFTAQCDFDARSQFDYRQATNCGCIARVVPKYTPAKECPCTVCAAGFGETPVSVDCGQYDVNATTADARQSGSASVPAVASNATNSSNSLIDPYIFSTCTSVDCSGACNGTCAINCDASGTICPYCENYEGEGAPTGSPVGNGDGTLKNFGESGSSTVEYALSRAVFLAIVSIAMYFR